MKIYIVSFQWKENNETEYISLLEKESSGDGDGVGTTEGDGQHARKISLR